MWYAVYTRARSEKKVQQELESRGIETYLPMLRSLKQWSDRRKWVEEPLLRSYVFVNISPRGQLAVLQSPHAVRFVCFEGKAAGIPDWQIQSMRVLLAGSAELEVRDHAIQAGERVEVVTGSLAGFLGEVVKVDGKKRLLLRIDRLGLSILVNVPAGGVVRIGGLQ